MSGGIPSLALKDEDVTKFLAASTHIGSNACDFQMESYVFKRRSDGESSQRSKKPGVDIRRSTAAQYFVDGEEETEVVTADKIAQLINEAISPAEEKVTLINLEIIKKLILYKDPKFLDIFLDEVVSFQHDSNPVIRVFIVQFIEEACKINPQILPKVMGNLNIMLQDASVYVQKRVIRATFHLYTVAIKWLCNSKSIDEMMVATWSSMAKLKTKIFSLIDCDNEGVRAFAVKYMECVVLSQSAKDEYCNVKQDEVSLDEIPMIMRVFKPRKLEEEAKDVFTKIVEFHNASHVSSCNLMVCMHVLTNIARKRFCYFPKVLQAFETLHANLPPTLSQSQVSSVRKNLRLHLFLLCKHPKASTFYSQISIMLSDLGATPLQIFKCFPNIDQKSIVKQEKNLKDDRVKTDSSTQSKSADQVEKPKRNAVDATAVDVFSKFTNENTADLVLVSMLSLPSTMPATFQNTYTPIAAAGTEQQMRHLARLLATQLCLAGFGLAGEIPDEPESHVSSDEEEEMPTKRIKTLISRSIREKPRKEALELLPSGSSQPKVSTKKFDFSFNVKPLAAGDSERLSRAAFNRILKAESAVSKKGGSQMRVKILTTLASQFKENIADDLKDYILENPRNRLDLGFSWIYQEFSAFKGFEGPSEMDIGRYEEIVNQLMKGILESEEQNCSYVTRFFSDLPFITEGMVEMLKTVCCNEKFTEQALNLTKVMISRRSPQKLLFLGVVSDLTLHEKNEIRAKAVEVMVEIYKSGNLTSFIQAFALRSLKFLLEPVPAAAQFLYFSKVPETWVEDVIKVCLHLYLSLLPLNHSLIGDLGIVYVQTTPDVKRSILRVLEIPVKNISMSSPELLHFVENCPQGAETFVTRIIHILTDKAPPSEELVARVRDLYKKRVQDVRFLIPIINGLKKREIIAALPELIKLNPAVVKEVFHRLVGSNLASPLSPADLLVALHNIDTSQCNLKLIIKATSLCFEEKHVYGHVVLAMVMQQLMEQNPLPILLMRTVIQSLANHPHLLGFVTNILQRLILKQVWNQPKIWEGFIKCCQRTKPQSFQILLQLPPAQLKDVLQSHPDLRDSLVKHIETFTEHQRAHIPNSVLSVIEVYLPKRLEREMSPPAPDEEAEGEPLPPGEEF